MNKHLILFTALIATASISFAQIQPGDVTGFWASFDAKTREQKSQIKIEKAGKVYNGKIAWLKEPKDNGKPKVDKHNPDVKLQTQPLLGIQLIKGFEFNDDQWENGTIYDPENGKTYSCKMWFENNNKNVLHVKGFIGVSLIGREVTWTREYLQK